MLSLFLVVFISSPCHMLHVAFHLPNHPKRKRTSVAGRCEYSEPSGYHIGQVGNDAREFLVSEPSRLVIRCRISATRDEESHDK